MVTAGQRVIDLHYVSIIQSRHGDPPRPPPPALADNAAGSVLVRVYSPPRVSIWFHVMGRRQEVTWSGEAQQLGSAAAATVGPSNILRRSLKFG